MLPDVYKYGCCAMRRSEMDMGGTTAFVSPDGYSSVGPADLFMVRTSEGPNATHSSRLPSHTRRHTTAAGLDSGTHTHYRLYIISYCM